MKRWLPMLVVVACGARPAAPVGDEALASRVDAYLAPHVEMKDFAGVVLVARGERVLVRRAYGGAPEDAPYAVGSIAKTVTAAAIELLATRGKLALGDPVGKYVTGLPYGDRVTIAQLLNHGGGIPDYYSFPEFAARHGDDIALTELVALIASKPLDFEPGTSERYSNSGYVLLAAVIEQVTHERYAAFVTREVLAKLHHAGDLTAGRPRDLAIGRDPGFPPELVQPASPLGAGWLVGNGSLFATADDLLAWLRDARAITTPYGWGVHDHAGHQVLEQDGRIAGYAAYAGVSRDDDIAVVIVGNIQSQAVAAIGPDLAEIARGKQVAEPARRTAFGGEPAASRFAGTYSIAPGFAITIATTPHGLTLAGPDGIAIALDRTGPTTFFFRPLDVEIGFADGVLVWAGTRFPKAAASP